MPVKQAITEQRVPVKIWDYPRMAEIGKQSSV